MIRTENYYQNPDYFFTFIYFVAFKLDIYVYLQNKYRNCI